MRFLVTGGSGYLGTLLIDLLARRDDIEEVVNVDVRPPGRANAKERYVARSVTGELADLCDGVDVAVHNAWALEPLRDAGRQRAICIGGTTRFLSACVVRRVRHVVFVSSDTAYGAQPGHGGALDESEPLRERHHFQYSAEKREAEGLVRSFAADHPEALVQIVRPTTVWGPRVANYLSRMMSRPFVFSALGHDPAIQLVHEDDAAAAMAAIVLSRSPGAFNVAPESTLPFSEVCRRLGVRRIPLPLPLLVGAGEVAWRLRLRWLTEAPGAFAYFLAYTPVLSSRRLVDELGFRFRYDVPAILDSYLAARQS